MVCSRYITVNGLHKGDNKDNKNNGYNANCIKLTTSALYPTSMEHTRRTVLVLYENTRSSGNNFISTLDSRPDGTCNVMSLTGQF